MSTAEDQSHPAHTPVPVWNLANIITMLRVLLVPVFAVLLVGDSTATRIAATLVFVLAALTDKLDGHIARSRGLITNFGKIADPIADKALVITALVLLWLEGTIPWWVPLVIVVRELGVTALRFVMIRRSVMAASNGGKLKTVLQIVFIVGYLAPWTALLTQQVGDVVLTINWWIMLIAVLVTVATGLDYAVRAALLARQPVAEEGAAPTAVDPDAAPDKPWHAAESGGASPPDRDQT